jgi:hypothetical protein
MAGNGGFEVSFYNDETGQWEVTPDPSSKPLAVRKKKKAAQAKEPSAGDYLATLGDVLVVNPRNSAAATLGGAAYDYAVKSTPRSVVRDITESAEDAGDWLRKEGKLIRAAPITESLRLLKAGFIDPLADPYRVFKQAATERARGNEVGGKKLAAMVPLAVAGVLPQGRGASKVATKAGVEAAEKATKKATKTATKGAEKKVAAKASEMAVTPKAKKKVAPVVKGIANPTQVVAEKYSPEIARRTRDVVGNDAPVAQWLEVADKLQGTQGNRPYQPESDLAFRDFDLGTYGMRKTIDAPRLFDLDVRRERYLPEVESNELVFQDIVNRPFMTGMADRTETATDITGLGPVDLDIPVREYGGQDYMKYNPFSWGVSTPTMGSNFMNTARRLKREFGVNPLWMPWRMQGSGSDFSKTTGEIMMSHANSTLGRDTRRAIDRFMKENYIPDFAGIDNPRGYEQFGEITGPQRKDMEKKFDATFAQEGALSQPLARAIITAPDQLNRKAFHLQNIAEIDPDAEIVVKAINPTYHQNTPGAYKGTLEPGLLESLNVAELIAPTLNEKYADLGDLSVFRGQNAPLTVENLARQRAEYEDLTRAFDAKLAAGNTKAKAPREPVPIGNVNKFMQSVFATGFLDDAAAQALYDKLVASGAQLK